MRINYKIGILEKSRKLDATWEFKYSTLNSNGEDIGIISENIYDQNTIPADDKSMYSSETIFLDSSLDEFYMQSVLENVVIDNEKPYLVEDLTTYNTVSKPFNVKLKFYSDIPLDVAELSIGIGDELLYEVSRKSGIFVPDYETKPYIYNLNIEKNGNYYTLSFKLNPEANVERTSVENVIDLLNQYGLIIKFRDIAANLTTWKSENIWKYIKLEDDVNNLEKLKIEFYDVKPEDKILQPNVEGECYAKIINLNEAFWGDIIPIIELDANSIGTITELDTSLYESTGIVIVKIEKINKIGYVQINAWMQIENAELSQYIKNATYVEGVLRKWILEDDRNRHIKIKAYVPKFMEDERFENFVVFTEKFLNTMYLNLNDTANIGILEKIARIGDFNNVEILESKLLDHFRQEFNIEINPNIDDMKKFLLKKKIRKPFDSYSSDALSMKMFGSEEYLLTPNQSSYIPDEDDQYKVTDTYTDYAFADIDDDEMINFMKYIYREIPDYNQYKGSYKGIKMMLNMLGLSVKLVELWAMSNNANVDDMLRSDELGDYPLRKAKTIKADIAKYYLSSRFDIDLEEDDTDFEEFNDFADNIVRLIFEVKPVTRLLRKLSYIKHFYINLRFSHLWLPFQNNQPINFYTYSWNLNNSYAANLHEYSVIEEKSHGDVTEFATIYNLKKLFIPFLANDAEVLFKSNVDHQWISGTNEDGSIKYDETEAGDVLTRKTTPNTYYNLHNIQKKLKDSQVEKFEILIKYDEVLTARGMKETISHEKIYKFDLPDWTDQNNDGKAYRSTDDVLIIEETANGFYLIFNGNTANAFNDLNLPESIFTDDNAPIIRNNASTRYITNAKIMIGFGIALGTNYLSFHKPNAIDNAIITEQSNESNINPITSEQKQLLRIEKES